MPTKLLIVQILLPFLGGCINALTFNAKRSHSLSLFFGFINLFISILIYISLENGVDLFYNLGDYPRTIGIEYKISTLNQPLVIVLNILLLLYLSSAGMKNQILLYQRKYAHLFYCLLLIIHTGLISIITSNDLFNIYVAIELVSIGSYVVLALQKNKLSSVYALDYLIIGSLGAIFILVAIGILLALTGELNITLIHSQISSIIVSDIMHTKLIKLCLALFVIGISIKIAFFPFSNWMLNVYYYADCYLISYLSGAGSIATIFLLYKFIHEIIGFNTFFADFGNILSYWSIISLFAYLVFSIKAHEFKRTIMCFAGVSTSYLVYILSFCDPANLKIFTYYLITDSIAKAGLFTFCGIIETKYYLNNQGSNIIGSLDFKEVKSAVRSSRVLKVSLIIYLLNFAGFPMSTGLINKLNLLNLHFIQYRYYFILPILLSFSFMLIAVYRLLENIYFIDTSQDEKLSMMSYVPKLNEKIILFTIAAFILLFPLFNNIVIISILGDKF